MSSPVCKKALRSSNATKTLDQSMVCGETSTEKVRPSMQEGLLMPDLDEVLLAIKFDYIICRGTA